MNVIDKMVEAVSPEMALKRQKARGILAIRNAQLDNLDKFMNSGKWRSVPRKEIRKKMEIHQWLS